MTGATRSEDEKKRHEAPTPAQDLPRISQPALRALQAAGYTRLDQLTAVSEADLLTLHGMGPKAIGILREALAARGQSFVESASRQAGKSVRTSQEPKADSR